MTDSARAKCAGLARWNVNLVKPANPVVLLRLSYAASVIGVDSSDCTAMSTLNVVQPGGLILRCLATAMFAIVWAVATMAAAQSADDLPRLPETEVIGQQPGPAPTGVPESSGNFGLGQSVLAGSVFSSPRATGYVANSSTTGTLINVPNLSIPMTVDVVTEQLRQDQQALQINDLLRDIGGAVKVNDLRRQDAFFLRGFEVRARDYRKNGFLDPTYTPRDFANVERIEILKGPASILYGAGQPSGAVNLITKKPLDCAAYAGDMQFGSFGLERYTVDATGPIGDQKSLLYRINAAYEDDGSFRDFGFAERTFVAPSLAWAIDDDTRLTWEGEYVNDRRRFDTGLVAINGDPNALPINRFLGEPDNDFQHYFDYRQTLMLTHRINEDWSWNFGGYSLFYGGPASATYPVAPATFVGPDYFFRARQNIGPWQEQYHSAIANIAGKFEGDAVTHNVVLGTEQGWLISDRFRAAQSIPSADPATWLLINAADPTYGVLDPATPFVFDSTYRENRHGVYVQDLVDIGEHWKVLAGARYDHVATAFTREIALDPLFDQTVSTDQTFDHGTPRVGIVYQPIPERLSYYAMYSDSFDPPGGGPRLTTDPLQPELGQIWEGGIKAKLFEGLTVTAAGFYITKENVTVDLFNAPFFETSQIGRQRSQGFELDALGQLTERWSMVGNWCYVDTLLSDPSNPAFDGQMARGVPHNTINVWSRYNVIQEEQRTLGAALGVMFVGERLGDYIAPPAAQFFLPGYTRWDAGLYYRRGRLDTSLYLENLFDTRYYTSSLSQLQIFPGAPFNVRAQVGYRF